MAFLPQSFPLHTCRGPSLEEPFHDLAPHSLRFEAGAGYEGGSSAHISSGSLHRAHRGLLGMGVRKGHFGQETSVSVLLVRTPGGLSWSQARGSLQTQLCRSVGGLAGGQAAISGHRYLQFSLF